MNDFQKLYKRIVTEGSDSVKFSELQYFVEHLGFPCVRVNGDHFVFRSDSIPELIILQPSGKMAKEYQVKQVRKIVRKYKLGGDL